MIIQSLCDATKSPLADLNIIFLCPPFVALFSQPGVVIIHSYERATGFGQRIRQIAEVLNHSLTTTVAAVTT